MKPDWDKLMDEFNGHKTALVADVDCTAAGKGLCDKHGVSGYPTLKWGEPHNLKDYEGGRDYNTMKKFADENLGPSCGPANLDLCDEEGKKSIAKFQKMDADELEIAIEEASDKVKKIEEQGKKTISKLDARMKELQEDLEKAKKKKDKKVAQESKKLGVKFMKAVAAANKKKEGEDDTKKEKADETKEEKAEDTGKAEKEL